LKLSSRSCAADRDFAVAHLAVCDAEG
jgi:hypothetical protein